MRDKILTFPESRGQCLWQNSSLGAESRGCKGCDPLLVATTPLTNGGQKGRLVQSAMVLGLCGHIVCVLAVKNMPVASPPCVHTSTLKGSEMQIFVPTPQITSLLQTKFPACRTCKLLGILTSMLQVMHGGQWPGRTPSLRRKLLWSHPCCTTVCTHQPKHREKASSHPNKNASDTPDHSCRCSSGSSILLLWTLTRIAPCSHRNTEVHLWRDQVPF